MMSSVGVCLCVCIDSVEPRQSIIVDSHHREKDLVALEKIVTGRKDRQPKS